MTTKKRKSTRKVAAQAVSLSTIISAGLAVIAAKNGIPLDMTDPLIASTVTAAVSAITGATHTVIRKLND